MIMEMSTKEKFYESRDVHVIVISSYQTCWIFKNVSY